MKKIKYIVMLSLLAVVFATSSCSDFLNINTDPNRVTGDNVTANLIFTQAENAVGRRAASRFVFLNNWMGYWSRSGTFIVEQEETTYQASNTFSETNWDDAYNILFDLSQVQTKALAGNDSLLAGASIILSVKLWQETVDQFGAVPYSKAFDYVNYPQPAYDPAATIYTDLLAKLDKAIVYLNAVSPKITTFAASDIIFCRGTASTANITLWKKFANTIRLRILLRQSEMSGFNPTAQLAKITTDGYLGAGQDVAVQPGYTNSTAKQNPFYAAFGLTPAGAPATTNNKPNNYFVNTIDATDKRLVRFFASPITGTDYGALGGDHTGAKTITGTEIGPGLCASATQDQFILPSFESLFFQAEAAARGWIPGGDATTKALYESAVTQSFTWLAVPSASTEAASYLASTSLATSNWVNSGSTVASKVKFIAFQKYIALCGVDAVESWSDFRRGVLVLPSGYLSWNPVVRNNASATLPNVLPYPQTEFTTNAVSIPTPNRNTASLFTEKLFWQP